MQAPSPDHCRLIVPLLLERDGRETKVELSAERVLRVFNIAPGTDLGEDYDHVFTNVSPNVAGASFDFFWTDEVRLITDPASDRVLWKADGEPSVR